MSEQYTVIPHGCATLVYACDNREIKSNLFGSITKPSCVGHDAKDKYIWYDEMVGCDVRPFFVKGMLQMIIRHMTEADTEQVIEMMTVFYASPAVQSNGSEEIFRNDIAACLSDSPFLEGYVFVEKEKIAGYSMLAKSFSTESGKPCIWIEDLYIIPEFRACGIGGKFFALLNEKYPDTVMRLEVEEENQNAVHLYKKCGFEFLPYLEMIKF